MKTECELLTSLYIAYSYIPLQSYFFNFDYVKMKSSPEHI